MPVCPAGDDPASNSLVLAPLSTTVRHLAVAGDAKSIKRKLKTYLISYFHIYIAEVRAAEGQLYLFVAIDRTSKLAFTELHEKSTWWVAADFLLYLMKVVPYRIHTVLTDNGTHFTEPKGESWSVVDITGMLERGRLTKPKLPWTNGQVGRMNRTIKDATVRASTTNLMTSFEFISRTSSPPTTSPSVLRPSRASRLTNTSARSE